MVLVMDIVITVIYIISYVEALWRLNTHVGLNYIFVSWTEEERPNSSYHVVYDLIGTNIHGVIDLDKGQKNVSITSNHPGSLYKISLFETSNDKNESTLGTGYQRSLCGNTFNDIRIGSSFNLLSPGFPETVLPGVICQWHFNSQSDIWYRIIAKPVKESDDVCRHHLTTNDNGTCFNQPFTVHNNSAIITYRTITSDDPFFIEVYALPALYPPNNISAVVVRDEIDISWSLPSLETENLTVILTYYISSYNYTRYTVQLDFNTSGHVINTMKNRGQEYGIRLFIRTQYDDSGYSDLYKVRSECVNHVILQPNDITIVNGQDYLPDVLCMWKIHVNSPDHWIMVTATNSNSGCTNSMIRTPSHVFMCNNHTDLTWIEETQDVEVTYSTGSVQESLGFVIKTVDKPTEPPRDLTINAEAASLYLTWKPPKDRPEVIVNYVIYYKIGPYTNTNVLNTTNSSNDLRISTSGNRGQLYVIKIAAITDGGTSNCTQPVYIRSSCGEKMFLLPQQTKIIIYPGSSRMSYIPSVHCSWTFATGVNLWFKITVDTMDLEYSDGCTKDFLQIANLTKLCGKHFTQEVVHRSNIVNIRFTSDDNNEGTGFILSVTAVGTPPDQPRNLTVSSSTYGLIIEWLPPLYRTEYITSYTLFYKHEHTRQPLYVNIQKYKNMQLLDSTKYPGTQFEIWMVSNGDVGSSIETEHVFVYTDCGCKIQLGQATSFIISPFYEEWRPLNAYCSWHVTSNSLNIIMNFVDFQFPDTNNTNCDHVTMNISGVGRLCQQTTALKSYVISSSEVYIVLSVSENTEIIRFVISLTTKGYSEFYSNMENDMHNSVSYITASAMTVLVCVYLAEFKMMFT